MSDSSHTQVLRARIPVSRRLLPFASFSLTAIGGMLSAWWMTQLFIRLRNDQSASIKGVLASLSSICQSAGMIYLFALIVGIIGIAVLIMTADEEEASLPGPAYLVGLPSLISPALSAFGIYTIIATFHGTDVSRMAEIGAYVGSLLVFSIAAGAVSLLMLAPIAFLPFSARIGKRRLPVLTIGLVLTGTLAMIALTFWLVGFSQEPANPVFNR